ncbi:MAG: Rha family transcriptional regulator [Clostridia bacterium]|nr:Rha family transcriptional regulator [Clostridia bacterium]
MTSLILNEYGMTEKRGVPVVDSRHVAEKFGKRHDHVLRDIQTAIQNFSEIGQPKFGESNFIPSHYRNEQNKKQPEYLLTRDGFSYIAMGFTGKKAAKFKIDYINAFNQMESFIKNLLEAKSDFPEFTDAIMAAHEEPKHYHFSNELDMINRIVLGQSAKQFREAHGIESGKSIRPYLNADQIGAVKALQRIDIGLIITIPSYEQRKGILEQQFLRIGQRRLTA